MFVLAPLGCREARQDVGKSIAQEISPAWTAVYYPEIAKIGDSSTWRLSPPLKSIEECRLWIIWAKHGKGSDGYVCGRNCPFQEMSAEMMATYPKSVMPMSCEVTSR